MSGAYLGWWVPVLVLAVPPLLLILLHLLSRLEDWMIKADERAAAVTALLEQVDEPDDVEVAVTRLLSGVADKRRRRVDSAPPQSPALRRRRLRAALARAAAARSRPIRRPSRRASGSAAPAAGGPQRRAAQPRTVGARRDAQGS